VFGLAIVVGLAHRDMTRAVGHMDGAVARMDHAVERMDESTAACNRAADACQSMADSMRLLVQQQVMRDRPQPGPGRIAGGQGGPVSSLSTATRREKHLLRRTS